MSIGRFFIVLAGCLPFLALPAGAADYTVKQAGKQFQPAEVTVKVGDVVKFQNDDGITHNVFSTTPGHTFNAGSQLPGRVLSVKFDKPGKIEVHCAMHPKMVMTVNVTQ